MNAHRTFAAVLAAAAAFCAVAASACGGSSSGEEFPRVTTLGEGDVFPSILNSSLGVGPNRMVLQITDRDDEQILGADVRVKLYDLNDSKPTLTAEPNVRFVPVELSYEDEQAGGERTTAGEGGAYVAYADFDRAGDWGMKVDVERDGEQLGEAPFRFNVLQHTNEPQVGDEAPRSMQQILANAPDIEEIDSSSPPRPQMHDVTIADAIGSGRPAVVAFATPAFCRSRTCAPVMDTVMDPLYQKYSAQAAFIHVEPYVLRDLRASFIQNPVPAALEWQLDSEPWIFVIDGEGRIAGKFQGIVAADEVESTLRAALGA
ncbi:MAG TPA: hypothetical protein VIH21_01160 [Dehalococcoidia bacterium]